MPSMAALTCGSSCLMSKLCLSACVVKNPSATYVLGAKIKLRWAYKFYLICPYIKPFKVMDSSEPNTFLLDMKVLVALCALAALSHGLKVELTDENSSFSTPVLPLARS